MSMRKACAMTLAERKAKRSGGFSSPAAWATGDCSSKASGLSTKRSASRAVGGNGLMQVSSRGNVSPGAFSSERCAFENLRQNQTSQMIGLFRVIGIFQSRVADRRYKIAQCGVDSISFRNYIHAACCRLGKHKRLEVSLEAPARARLTDLFSHGRQRSNFVPAAATPASQACRRHGIESLHGH